MKLRKIVKWAKYRIFFPSTCLFWFFVHLVYKLHKVHWKVIFHNFAKKSLFLSIFWRIFSPISLKKTVLMTVQPLKYLITGHNVMQFISTHNWHKTVHSVYIYCTFSVLCNGKIIKGHRQCSYSHASCILMMMLWVIEPSETHANDL